MSLMVRDFIQTGQAVPRGGIPIPVGGGAQPIRRPGPPGSSLTFPGTWTTLPAVSPGGGLGPTVIGIATDIVNLIYADPTLALNQWPLTAIAGDGSAMTVDIRTTISGADGIKAGDLILFSNARGSAMQVVTGVNGQVVSELGSKVDQKCQIHPLECRFHGKTRSAWASSTGGSVRSSLLAAPALIVR
jgi:hypothetical protein